MTLPTGLRQTNGGLAAPPFTKGPYTWDQDVTLSGTNTLSGATTISGAATLSSTNTFSGATTVSNTLTTTNSVTHTDLRFTETVYSSTAGAINANVSCVALSSSAALAMTIAAPVAGRFLTIYQKDAGTAGHTVTLSAGTWNGTHTIATFNALNETLVVFGVSATRFIIVENIGSVGLS